MEETAKKPGKIHTKTWTRQSVSLLNRCIGVLFFYFLFFSLALDFLINPICDKLLSLSLLTVPSRYVSLDTAVMVFRHPLVLLALLIKAAMFCLSCLVKTSGLFICLEAAYQNKPVRFFYIIPAAIKQVKHVIHPRNWPIFIYLILIQPLVNSDVNTVMSTLVMPEFIMDVISAKLPLNLLYHLVMLVALFFFIRYMFLQQYFILRQQDFKTAAGNSISLAGKKKFFINYKLWLIAVVAVVFYLALPAVALFIGDVILVESLSSFTYTLPVNHYIMNAVGFPMLKSFGSICANLLVSAYLLIAFHKSEEILPTGEIPPIELPEMLLKKTGKIRTLKFFRHLAMLFGILLTLSLTLMLSVAYEYYPELMDSRYEPALIIAHKGYSSKAPENTMAAFDKAAADPIVSYIELDVRESSDGTPVVIHNGSISDATNGADSRSIYEVSDAELSSIPAPYMFNPEFSEQRIPSLESVLKKYADTTDFIIEIKMSSSTPELPAKIVALMEKYRCTESSMIHSGSYEALELVKKANPSIRCGYIITFGLGGYYDLPYADFFSVEHHLATEDMVRNAHLRNKDVFVWTINSEDSMKKLSYSDVDGVITDYPDTSNEIVNELQADLLTTFLSRLENEIVIYNESDNVVNDY